MFLKRFSQLLVIVLSMAFVTSCGGEKKDPGTSTDQAPKKKVESMVKEDIDPMKDPGVGPIKELTLPAEIDDAMAAAGEKVYKEKCTACHKISKKYIGPSPKGIFERRNPAWVMNMILDPEGMVKENEIAKALLAEFNGTPMANQNLTEEEARNVVEYFRTL